MSCVSSLFCFFFHVAFCFAAFPLFLLIPSSSVLSPSYSLIILTPPRSLHHSLFLSASSVTHPSLGSSPFFNLLCSRFSTLPLAGVHTDASQCFSAPCFSLYITHPSAPSTPQLLPSHSPPFAFCLPQFTSAIPTQMYFFSSLSFFAHITLWHDA